MTNNVINVGTTPNDRNGDSLRTAFQKVNANFEELYTAISNIGSITTLSEIAQDIIPATDDTYNLGSLDKQWHSLYVGVNTLYINRIPLTISDTGNILVNGDVYSGTLEPITVNGGLANTIYSASSLLTGCKLVIKVEGELDNDTVPHTQTCEATVAAIYNSSVEPVISIYGVVYTSPSPLATFTVRRGINNTVEVVALNSQAVKSMYVSVHAIKFDSYYA